VERAAHDRRLHDLAPRECSLEGVAVEALQPRRERDVRRGRMLRLQRGEPGDRLGRGQAGALEQQLTGGQRRRELLPGERALGQLRPARSPR
jgi:hypothetical protein